jgi:N-formylglutamate amidohydrolase
METTVHNMNAAILIETASLATRHYPQLQQSVDAIRASLYREGAVRERRAEAANHARVLADQLEELGQCASAANLLKIADMVAR